MSFGKNIVQVATIIINTSITISLLPGTLGLG